MRSTRRADYNPVHGSAPADLKQLVVSLQIHGFSVNDDPLSYQRVHSKTCSKKGASEKRVPFLDTHAEHGKYELSRYKIARVPVLGGFGMLPSATNEPDSLSSAVVHSHAPDMAHIPFVDDDGDDDGYLADMLISPSASPAPTMLETPAIDTDTLHAPDYSQADDDEWDSDFADNLVLPGNSSPATMCDRPNMSSSEHSDDDKQYDFSHIVSHKGGNLEREYRVRFVGYTQDHDLWFKEADLRMTASEAVDAYEKQLSTKKRGRKHTK